MFRALISASVLCAVASSSAVRSWLTTSDPGSGAVIKMLEEQAPITEQLGNSQVQFVIDAGNKKQSILGYGAGLPQSSAYVLNNLKSRNPTLYNSVLQKLFGRSADGGGINVLRFPIGSCDFSMTSTTYDEHSGDYELKYFAVDQDSQLIASVLKDVLAINPNLVIVGESLD